MHPPNCGRKCLTRDSACFHKQNQMKLSNNKILITGGASGIGLGLAERFIRENNTIIICGRRESALNEVSEKFPAVITRVCDIAYEEERIALFKWVAENHPDLNVLVNNAGIQNWMNVGDDNFYKRAEQEIAINITAPIHLISLFLNLQSPDTIMNVTSGLAFVPFSKVPVYSGTKGFLRSFTLSLRHQLKSTNTEVVEIIPPALNTDLGGKGIHDAHPSVRDFIESIFKQLQEGKMELTFGMSESRAAANNESIAEYFSRLNP
jgi:uncharacterized oxidoreductase